jgi:hypothetical protein
MLFSFSFSEISYWGGGSDDGVMEMGVRVAMGLLLWVGVGEGVISVLADISTSSASRYHFLRRV